MAEYFSKRAKQAVALVSGGDTDGTHADHMRPKSHGGPTTIENCQLLSPSANLRKGSKFMELRAWQSLFIKQWDSREEGDPFLLVAIPGGGKTFAALTVARNWRAAAADRRVIIVVPTDNLRTQWKEEAAKIGLQLQTKEFGTNFKHGFQGVVTTYASVASSPLVFRKLCSVAPTLVIFDEMHHCGEDATYGRAIKESFELAKERLLLSGTPWKTSGQPIPFVKYDGNGWSVADFRYDYPDALQDECVRWLVFSHANGEIRFDTSGIVEHVNQTISDDEAKERLRKLLDSDGDYVREQIRSAHRKLLECRRTVSDAAAMAACIDKVHAERIAKVIEAETGCRPSVIVSDDDIANDSVSNFRDANTEWLVSVRQVSEGTDIKRLQVLCYFTNWVTEIFFRQLVGRVSRVRDMDDFEAYVYLPADPRLIRFSQNIENAQTQSLRLTTPKTREPSDRDQPDLFPESFSTSHSGIGVVVIGNREFPESVAHHIERAAESAGISMEKAAKCFDIFSASPSHQPIQSSPAPAALEDTLHALRKKCQRDAFRLSKILKCDPKDVHGKFKPQKDMTEAELKAKLASLKQQMRDAT